MSISKLKLAPIYYNIFEELLGEVESGKLGPNEKFPSENDLCQRFNVSRGTIREALKLLEQHGVITRTQGKGTFITEKKFEQEVTRLMGFSEVMKRYGIEATAKLLSLEVIPANDRIRDRLNLLQGENVVAIKRLRLGDGIPLIIERSYFVYSIFKPILAYDLESSSIFELLYQHTPYRLGYATQFIEAVISRDDESELFEISTGSPLLLIKRLVHLIDGRAFEFSEDLYRSDKLKFTIKTAPYEKNDMEMDIIKNKKQTLNSKD
ncbi:MAG: GntR family transcriptional regulator [Ignavibacteriales bacterium]|nr:GntR family transcriptional regulator [Ignavibacteriales bacterium]HOJ17740.1 GntR family transcriptional regulator [Ignavibacteriaceae bacterium]HPO56423.1 GntR family transcriptional regulator [Ignavibacteriaceae bacterium]